MAQIIAFRAEDRVPSRFPKWQGLLQITASFTEECYGVCEEWTAEFAEQFRAGLDMAKLDKLLTRVCVFVLFLLTGTRLAIARILPWSSQKPPSAKVFALSDAAWAELRAADDPARQDKSESKNAEDQKAPSKNDDAKDKSKTADCNKGNAKNSEQKKGTAPSGEEKKEDSSKRGECDSGPGGGDGDTGGTGG